MKKYCTAIFFLLTIFPSFGNLILFNCKNNSFFRVSKMLNFQPIQTEKIQEPHEIEKHNFNKQPIRLLFHEDSGIITSYDNDKRVTGFFGEIWTFLSEYANFTLVVKKVFEKRIGIRPSLTSNYNGLLRYIESDEADVVAKMEMFAYWTDVVDYFLPLWNDRYRLFAQLYYRENTFWMMKLCTFKVWFAGSLMFILFIIFSMSVQILTNSSKKSQNSIIDFILYYHGVFGQRSFFLLQLQEKYRILNTCACLFPMLMFSFYNAKILDLMVNKTPFEPFDGLEELYRKTEYMVLSEKDSVIHLAYEFMQIYEDVDSDHPLRYLIKSKRIKFLPKRSKMYFLGCTSENNYAILESEYLKENVVKYGCTFEPIGEGYFHNWIGAGVKKNFMYKRTIDLGILKLFESGILNALKTRLVGLKKFDRNKTFEPIDLQKIYALLGMFIVGLFLSIIILLSELTFHRLNHK